MEKTLFRLQFDTSDQLEDIKKETLFEIIYITEPRLNLGYYQPGEVICALNQTTAA
jgi:hypothetical protein|tara:strand:+ start:342 stop:509 length:168 start_codon:yes stop_codon:yes gene_type:complete